MGPFGYRKRASQQATPAQQATAGMMTGREFAPALLEQLMTDPRSRAFDVANTPVAGESGASLTNRLAAKYNTRRDPRVKALQDAIQSSGGLMTPEGINANAVDAISKLGSPTQQTAATSIRQALAKDRFNLNQLTSFRDNVIAQYPKLAPFRNIITPDNITDLLEQVAGVGGTTKGIQKDSAKIVRDEVGNLYESFTIFNPNDGKTISRTVPYAGSPDEPVGKLTIIAQSPTDVEGKIKVLEAKTREEGKQDKAETEQNIKEDREKEYNKARVEQVVVIPDLKAQKDETTRIIKLLQTVPIGGPINAAEFAIDNYFGTVSADKAELQFRLGTRMYQALKPFFGGVISDSEAKRVERLFGGLKRGKDFNIGVVRALKKTLDNTYEKALLFDQAETFDEFRELIGNDYPSVVSTPERNVIDFNTLKK